MRVRFVCMKETIMYDIVLVIIYEEFVMTQICHVISVRWDRIFKMTSLWNSYLNLITNYSKNK